MYNLLIVDDESMVRLGMKSCVDWERLQVDNVYEASMEKRAFKPFRIIK